MARYLARPPIATDRLSQLDDGRSDAASTRREAPSGAALNEVCSNGACAMVAP